MFVKVKTLLRKWFGSVSPDGEKRTPRADQSTADVIVEHGDDSVRNFPQRSSSELVPYDESLLERSRTQWQFGDWASLTRLDRDTLQHHPDRAKLALLAAAGHQARGNTAEAHKFTRLAIDWGCSKKLVSQILIAGVQNTLARAAAISGQSERALKHFQGAMRTGSPQGDLRLLTQARLVEQLGQLGIPLQALNALPSAAAGGLASSVLEAGKPSFTIEVLAKHNLGNGWAANTVNTVIFRHHGILTADKQQYTAFYVDEQTLRLVQRNLVTDRLTTHDIPGHYNLRDAHNSISLGLDRAGHLHISYDHHATQLRYRRSIRPHEIAAWTDELPMTGVSEDRVTYPTFVLPHDGHPLTLLYRDGVHNKGSARIKTYSETSEQWTDHDTPILSGATQHPWTSNAYWNHPAVGTDGSLHLSFVWRTDSVGEEGRVNNVNIGYARSMDGGLTWESSNRQPYQLPITQVNAETVHPVSPGSNLINQTSMALDSQNRPHIAFYSDDADGIPQYQHLYFDGKVWHHQFISARTSRFTLAGGGTLQIPISRPEIVIDPRDNVYVIFRGDLTQDRMFATKLPAPHFTYEPGLTQLLWPEPIGYSEPIIDRSRWQQEHVLTMLLQANQQPDGDRLHEVTVSPVHLVDFDLF